MNCPEILLLSLAFEKSLDEDYSSLIHELDKSTHLNRAKLAGVASQHLIENKSGAILVSDEGLTRTENKAVLDKVVLYARISGLVIFGLHLPKFTRMDIFDNLFSSAFSLPWKAGAYHRSDFEFNPSCSLPPRVASTPFPMPYSMKVLHIKHAQPHEKIFVPVSDVKTQSLVFPPDYVDQTQAAVIGARVGNGYVTYIGYVDLGDFSNRTELAT